MEKKTAVKTFISDIPKNLFSGFVVSLIALPLGLGLALASGAPPISGIIAAIVGGTVVAILGGSNVTITGPGNGLLDKFIKEDGDYEKEDIKPKYKKNAGGYTSGVLIDYQLD